MQPRTAASTEFAQPDGDLGLSGLAEMSTPRQIDPARLRAARERLGLSELQLARRIQVSSSTINRAAHGHHSLSSDTMRKLCLELGVSEAHLFGDDETDDIGSMLPMLTAEQRSQKSSSEQPK
jgi:DNA-binding transcriptional regulator YiaG